MYVLRIEIGNFNKNEPLKNKSPHITEITEDVKDNPGIFEYSVEDAMSALGYGQFQVSMAVITAIVMMTCSFDFTLPIVGGMLACEWPIPLWQNCLLVSVVLAGMVAGCLLFGILSDKYGRRTTVSYSMVLILIFSTVSCCASSFPWLLLSQALNGLGYGCVGQALNLCIEFFSKKHRGWGVLSLIYITFAAAMTHIGVAWGLTYLFSGWRSIVSLSAVPALLALLLMKNCPESVRYLRISGQLPNAEETLNQMSKLNKKKLPNGQLCLAVQCVRRGRISDLLWKEYRRSTLLLWFIWFATGFCHQGFQGISPSVARYGNIQKVPSVNSTSDILTIYTSTVSCLSSPSDEFINALWSCGAQLPVLLVFSVICHRYGRKKLLRLSCFLTGAISFGLLIGNATKIASLGFLYAGKGILLIQWPLVMIMTVEAFPTTLRGVAMGTGIAFEKFGVLLSPYALDALLFISPTTTVCVFGSCIILAGIAASALPWETKEMALMEIH